MLEVVVPLADPPARAAGNDVLVDQEVPLYTYTSVFGIAVEGYPPADSAAVADPQDPMDAIAAGNAPPLENDEPL